MKWNMTLSVKKRNQPEFLIWLIVIMPFTFGVLFDLFNLPNLFKYVLDICWLFLFFLLLFNTKKIFAETKKSRILSVWILAFLILTLVLYTFNYQSILYYLWGVRNNFRFYVLFFACIAFLKREDIADYLELFDKLFWINAGVCVVQHFLLGLRSDYLGGLFGSERGCNGYTNIFFIVIAVKSVLYYLNKRESLLYCVSKCGTMMIIAAFAELKFFYVEFVFIVGMAVLVTNFSWRKLLIIILGSLGIILGIRLVAIAFPATAQSLSLQGLFELASSDAGYTSAGDLNRLTAIQTLSKNILTTDLEQVFGLGLGNCDSAGYSFLTTPFYTQYSYLHYSWFSTAFLFLETGYLGLLFFFGFFILIFVLQRKISKEFPEDKVYCQISAIVAICCVFIAIYNSSLRTEAGYMVYLVLSFPFIVQKGRQNTLSKKL